MTSRTLLIGLDGATFDVLDPLMAAGVLPRLERLTAGGVRAKLRSTIPALTPPAWTSLVTGRSPGAHSIFDFFRKADPWSQHFRFLTSRDVECPPVWSLASEAGLRATVLNFPLTYPPPGIRGHVVPGGFMPWRQLRLGCHPTGLFDRLKAHSWFNPRELALDMTHEAKAIEGCAEEEYEPWIDMHIRRERQWVDILLHLAETEPAEFMAVLFDGVDKIQHLCWRFLDPSANAAGSSAWDQRVREKCREYFRELDGLIGTVLDRFGDDTTVILASDHGFGPQVRTFFVNAWLEQRGDLVWQADRGPAADATNALGLSQLARHVYEIDWTRTRAFAPLPSGNGIHLVCANKNHPGGIPPAHYDEFRHELAADLLRVVDPKTGEAVVSGVWTREELFAGVHLALAPDLTLELQDGGLISILRSADPIRRRPFATGTHRPDGVFVVAGREFRRGVRLEPLSILDVAPLLLHSLDVAVPASMEGRFVSEAFDADALRHRRVRHGDGAASPEPVLADPNLDPEAEAEIMKRLQALGYVE